MPMMIAVYPDGAEGIAELEAMGFRKTEVWLKHSIKSIPQEAEEEFWGMKYKPFQFAAFNFWGAGPD